MALFAYDLQRAPIAEMPDETMATFRQILRKVPIIVADNVAEYADGQENPSFKIGPLAPPFPAFWIEHRWKHPNRKDWQLGGLFIAEPDSRWRVKASFYMRPASDPRGGLYLGWMKMILNDTGYFLGPPASGVTPSIALPPQFSSKGLDSVVIPMFLTIMFLHCKNVVRTEHAPPAKLEKRTIERGNPPMLKYHTIEIEPLKTILRTEGQIEKVGLERALHICRGHFAHYAEDGPGLFGRGLHGNFWIPAHARGTEKKGVVISDYAVKAPAGAAESEA